MTFLELKNSLAEHFSAAGFEAPDLEAHFIVCEAAGIPDREFALHAHERISSEAEIRANAFLARRLANEPWQYIFGHAIMPTTVPTTAFLPCLLTFSFVFISSTIFSSAFPL